MNGIWILLLIILSSALPAILVFFWLKSKKPAVTLPWFLGASAAGIVSFLLAALIHDIFIPGKKAALWPVLFTIFVRIALVEEVSRIAAILPFLKTNSPQHRESSFGAALGLAAGLGFAVIESAYHGITNLNITILRLFTAAPLHAACGIRAGTAVFTLRQYPLKALRLFASTVLIHGTYNLIIVSPAYPSALAAVIAYVALFSSLSHLKPPIGNAD